MVKYNSKPTLAMNPRLPAEILARVEQICKEQGRVFSGCVYCSDLMDTFCWSDAKEGGDFWLAVYYGDLSVFYDRYPDRVDTLKNVFKL